MDTVVAERKLNIALQAQRFRQVGIQALTRPSQIDLSQVPKDLADSLAGVRRQESNWSRIGEQLAVLRDGLNTNGDFLRNIYIAASSGALRVVVVTAVNGPATADWYKRQFDFTWTVAQSLEHYIQEFELDPNILASLDFARQHYLNASNPAVKAAVDIAWSAIQTSRASGGPVCLFITLSKNGVSSELATLARSLSGLQRAQGGFGVQPILQGMVWDHSAAQFDEHSLYFGALNVVHSRQLKAGLSL